MPTQNASATPPNTHTPIATYRVTFKPEPDEFNSAADGMMGFINEGPASGWRDRAEETWFGAPAYSVLVDVYTQDERNRLEYFGEEDQRVLTYKEVKA